MKIRGINLKGERYEGNKGMKEEEKKTEIMSESAAPKVRPEFFSSSRTAK